MIKTIRDIVPYTFDKAVNQHLYDGWRIMKLEAVKGDKLVTLIAFLSKEN